MQERLEVGAGLGYCRPGFQKEKCNGWINTKTKRQKTAALFIEEHLAKRAYTTDLTTL